jgi:hypothetical protein
MATSAIRRKGVVALPTAAAVKFSPISGTHLAVLVGSRIGLVERSSAWLAPLLEK